MNNDIDRVRKVWRAMRHRCEMPSDPSYRNYGGRGIAVCPEWAEFAMFLADMGVPEKGMTLDRIDNDGPYAPSNCRWASRFVQARNTRANRLIEHNGRTQCLKAWADETGHCESFLRRRMDVQGMTFAQAIATPKRYSVWRRSRVEPAMGLHE